MRSGRLSAYIEARRPLVDEALSRYLPVPGGPAARLAEAKAMAVAQARPKSPVLHAVVVGFFLTVESFSCTFWPCEMPVA